MSEISYDIINLVTTSEALVTNCILELPHQLIFNCHRSLERYLLHVVCQRHSYRQTYGDITGWDVSEVTDMHRLFYDLDDFNEDAQQQSLALGTCSVPGTTVPRNTVSFTCGVCKSFMNRVALSPSSY